MRTLTSHTSLSAQLAARVGAVAIALAAGSAFAAPAKPAKPAVAASAASVPASAAKAEPAEPLLTRDQLRACRAQQTKIPQLQKDLDAEQAAIEALKADVLQRGDALNKKLETIDKTKQEAIDSYNADIKERQALVDQYDAKVTAFNSHIEAAKAESDAFGRDCKNRRFLDADAKAIEQGK